MNFDDRRFVRSIDAEFRPSSFLLREANTNLIDFVALEYVERNEG